MAKSNRGGKAGSATAPQQNQQSQQQQSAILTQRRQQRQAQAQQRAAQRAVQQAQQQAQQQGFNPLTQAQIQQNQQAQTDFLDASDINVRYAIKQYGRADQQANGFSRAQNLNNKLETGGKLDQTEKKMVKYMDLAMQPLKSDTMLIRGDHAIHPSGSGLMQRLGVANYQNMTPAQLNAALVGKTFTEQKYLSTSYDVTKNVFLSGNQSGGRSLVWNIKAKAGTKFVQARTDQAEYVLARGGQYKITGARFTGGTAYPRQGGPLKQIVIDVEVL